MEPFINLTPTVRGNSFGFVLQAGDAGGLVRADGQAGAGNIFLSNTLYPFIGRYRRPLGL